MFDVKEVRVKVGKSELIFETGRMAKQANGAVFAKLEGTAVIATACCGSSIRDDLDFVPLSVEYNEKYYAAGKIPGGFLKREGRPKDREVLVCRLIDRPIRPLFSKEFKRELQVVPTVISTDQLNPPDVTAMCAASAAVTISDIPFEGPVAAVRVGYLNGEFLINPTYPEIEEGVLDIIVAGTKDGITMVEGGGQEVSEEILLEAIELAHESIIRICDAQLELRKLAGKEKLALAPAPAALANEKEIIEFARPKMNEACFVIGKFTRGAAIKAVKNETLEKFRDSIAEEDEKKFSSLFHQLETEIVRESILKNKKRTDGRGPDDIRPITCEIDVLPRTHGAALFTRGETQALAITTLGTVYDEQIMDDIDGDRRENFMLHYNFPPFSVGETGRMGTGRREIGHGHLAHRSISPMLPTKEAFPYTIRVVSEVLESNGSSSMATVCGGSLSLLNSGVPMKRPVAGIAMGLITDGIDSVVLSDILGEEDHLGDMDFKVSGTTEGITAFQMDIKVDRIQPAVMKTALEQAKHGRMHILGIMDKIIEKPRESLSEYAPRIINFKVDPEKIGLLIGPGGKTIKGINEKYSVETNIENDGQITIYCRESKSAEMAKAAFIGLLEEPEIGRTYDGVVRRIVDFGAFIEFLPGKEGLCHISKMSGQRINDVKDVLELGQEVPVKIIEIDKMGRVNLSLLYEGSDEAAPQQRDSRPPRPNGHR